MNSLLLQNLYQNLNLEIKSMAAVEVIVEGVLIMCLLMQVMMMMMMTMTMTMSMHL